MPSRRERRMRKFRLKTSKGKQVANRLNEIVDKDTTHKRGSRENLAKVLLSAEKFQSIAAEKSRQELFVKRSQEAFGESEDECDDETYRSAIEQPPTNEDWSNVNNDLFDHSGSELTSDSDETLRKPISPLRNSVSPTDSDVKASLKHSLKSFKKISKIVPPKEMSMKTSIAKEIIAEETTETETEKEPLEKLVESQREESLKSNE